MSDKRPIGVFDSGIGGLTVAKAIKEQLPNESIIYFGDARHLPYGDKSPETIQAFSHNITSFLKQQNCKAIVIACNTASSNAYETIKNAAEDLSIIDVITPVAENVAKQNLKKVGVVATKATIESHLYRKFIQDENKAVEVVELATPLFVPIIEEGLTDSVIAKEAIKHYLSQPKMANLDALILGCTHYPLIQNQIKNFYKGDIKVIDSPKIVAKNLYQLLGDKGLISASHAEPKHQFYVSDLTANFEFLAKTIFGKDLNLQLKTLH